MTPQEKAKELVLRFATIGGDDEDLLVFTVTISHAKKCAIICVDEIVNGNFGEGYNHVFWQQVKQEIEAL